MKAAHQAMWFACVAGLCGNLALAAPEGKNPITVSVALRGDYTDNRDSSATDEQSNADFYVTPRVDAYLHTERTLLDLFYAPSYRYRSDPADTQNDSEFLHDLGVNIDHNLSQQTALRLREHFTYQDDPSIEENGADVRINESYFINRLDVGARQHLNSWTFVDLSGGYTVKSYEESVVADESDEDQSRAALMVWRQLSRLTAVQGTAGLAMYGYESTRGLDRDFDVVSLSAGIDQVFSAQVRGSLSAGAQMAEYADESLDSSTSPYALVSAMLTPTPAFRIDSSLAYGLRDADVYPFASQEFVEGKIGLTADPSALLTLGLDGMVRLSTYDEETLPDGAVAPLQATSGDETTTAITGRGTWKISQQSRLTLRQRFEDVDSDVDAGYTKNTTSLEYSMEL